MKQVRKPAVAALFYPSDKTELKELIDSFYINTIVEKKSFVKGLVAPHAGYIYSGLTAANSFHQIKEKSYKRVYIISPSHREYFPGVSIYSGDAYDTPFSELQVDVEMRNELTSSSRFIFSGIEGHRAEHGIEVELPFLIDAIGHVKIIPIVMGDQRKEIVDELAKRISFLLDDESLVIASSDLSHFYQKKKAYQLDSIVAERITSFQYDELQSDLDDRICEACGGGPIVAMMKACGTNGYQKSEVLHRSDSGDVSGDNNEVVGYLSAVIYQ